VKKQLEEHQNKQKLSDMLSNYSTPKKLRVNAASIFLDQVSKASQSGLSSNKSKTYRQLEFSETPAALRSR
jgi:hypothetical protein